MCCLFFQLFIMLTGQGLRGTVREQTAVDAYKKHPCFIDSLVLGVFQVESKSMGSWVFCLYQSAELTFLWLKIWYLTGRLKKPSYCSMNFNCQRSGVPFGRKSLLRVDGGNAVLGLSEYYSLNYAAVLSCLRV